MTTEAFQDHGAIQAAIDLAPFHQFLQPVVVASDAEAGTITLRLDLRRDLTRVSGEPAAHGGVIAALSDIASHAAIMVRLGRNVPTVDLRIDYLRPASGQFLLAEATILRSGRTLATVDVRILTDEKRLAAVARATFLTGAGK